MLYKHSDQDGTITFAPAFQPTVQARNPAPVSRMVARPERDYRQKAQPTDSRIPPDIRAVGC